MTNEQLTDRKVIARTVERVERIELLLGLSLGYNDGPDLTADPEHADQFFRALDGLREDLDLVTTRGDGIANWETPADRIAPREPRLGLDFIAAIDRWWGRHAYDGSDADFDDPSTLDDVRRILAAATALLVSKGEGAS